MNSGVLVVGAARRRQGLGHFVARAFHDEGVAVLGVVGRSEASSREAAEALAGGLGRTPGAFSDLEEALATWNPRFVAVCTPLAHHGAHAHAALRAGAHVLCEKPLVWGDPAGNDAAARALVEESLRVDRLLDVVTQWPQTLPWFDRLHRRAPGPPRSFEMTLGPTSTGWEMVLDSASHPLSLLHALVGVGRVEGVEACFDGPERVDVTWTHTADGDGGTSETACRLRLEHHPTPPRPARYSLNGFAVERTIRQPGYRQVFRAGAHEVSLVDPLRLRVRRFLQRVTRGESTDLGLIDGVVQLEQLVVAARSAAKVAGFTVE